MTPCESRAPVLSSHNPFAFARKTLCTCTCGLVLELLGLNMRSPLGDIGLRCLHELCLVGWDLRLALDLVHNGFGALGNGAKDAALLEREIRSECQIRVVIA